MWKSSVEWYGKGMIGFIIRSFRMFSIINGNFGVEGATQSQIRR